MVSSMMVTHDCSSAIMQKMVLETMNKSTHRTSPQVGSTSISTICIRKTTTSTVMP